MFKKNDTYEKGEYFAIGVGSGAFIVYKGEERFVDVRKNERKCPIAYIDKLIAIDEEAKQFEADHRRIREARVAEYLAQRTQRASAAQTSFGF